MYRYIRARTHSTLHVNVYAPNRFLARRRYYIMYVILYSSVGGTTTSHVTIIIITVSVMVRVRAWCGICSVVRLCRTYMVYAESAHLPRVRSVFRLDPPREALQAASSCTIYLIAVPTAPDCILGLMLLYVIYATHQVQTDLASQVRNMHNIRL